MKASHRTNAIVYGLAAALWLAAFVVHGQPWALVGAIGMGMVTAVSLWRWRRG